MSYHRFYSYIIPDEVRVIFELGSRDLEDAVRLTDHFTNSKCYSFECNPDCLRVCRERLNSSDYRDVKKRVTLIEKAVSITNGPILFRPFDLTKYNNMGASSIFEIDFSKRSPSDHDYDRGCVQTELTVDGTRIDTYMDDNNISAVDLLCIDLQGYELNALKSMGEKLHTVKHIITECSIESTYTGGANFAELNKYLEKYDFKYIASNRFGEATPDMNIKGFSEIDALFQRT
jgi:FkbM family methyltransferase